MNGKLWCPRGKWMKRLLVVSLLYTLLLPSTGSSSLLWSYSIKSISAFSISETGNFIAVGCQDGFYYIFDTWGNLTGSGNIPDPIVSLDVANSGELLIGSEAGYTFCTRNGVPTSSFRSSPVRSVSMSADGKSSLVCCRGNLFINEGNSMMYQLEVPNDFPIGVMSSDGSLACAASGKSLHIFVNGEFQKPYNLEEDVKHLLVSGNGRKIVFSTNKEKIGYLDAENMELQLKDLNSSIVNMAMCSKGDIVLVSTTDRLVWLEKGTVTDELPIHEEIHDFSLSEDGSFAVIGEKGVIKIVKTDGTYIFTHGLENHTVASEMSGNNLLVVCTDNGIYTFQLFQQTKNSNRFNPISSRRSLPPKPSLKESWSIPVSEDVTFFTADVDGDGFTELVLREGSVLKLLDGDGNQKSMKDTGEPIILFSPLDIDGDTVPEIPLTFNSAGLLFSIYDWKKGFKRTYDLESLRGGITSSEGTIVPFAALNIDDDDHPEILASVHMGYSCKPRGVVSIDSASGDIEWFYQMGPSVHADVVEDIDVDGNVDIVLGSVAPCNCGDDEQFPDCETYVIALSSRGEELWRVHLGTGYKRVEVCAEDVDEHEGVEIVGFGYEASENWGKFFVLNSFGEYLYGSEVEYSIFPGAVGDIDSDGRKEIVTIDSRGYLSIFTSDLQEKSKKRIKENINRKPQLYLNDINGDGMCEILLKVDKELLIFDKNLEILWNKIFESEISFTVTNFFRCKNTLLVLSDRLYAYAYEETGELPCPLWEITERTLREEGINSLNTADSLFETGEYRASELYYEVSLDKFSNLEDQEKVEHISKRIIEISHIIFKQNIKIGMIVLAVCDVISCSFLMYFWVFKKRWFRLGEGVLLLSLPVLLGLFQVYQAAGEYLSVFVAYAVPSLLGSAVIILRQNILGFLRTVAAVFTGHKDLLVLSIMKSDELHRISVESIEEKFNPIKESREITFPLETKDELIKKVKFMMEVLSQYSIENVQERSLDYAEKVFRETGKVIYRKFIPNDFFGILKAKFLLLEVEDTEIPWELMYGDEFFALKYGISRRIVATDKVKVRNSTRKGGRRALVISDPRENLQGASLECDIVYKRLKRKMDVVFVEGKNANLQKIANLFGQGFDIIHYAGHVFNGLVLSDGVMNSRDIKDYIVGAPVVFVNGCRSEELARAFLLGGAMAYVGTIHPVHDSSAADIAADFYDLCLQYQIGEALRRARISHMKKDLVWASLIMYGDPTLKLL